MIVKNYMEIVVEECLGELLQPNTERNLAIRNDPVARAKIMAQALNCIPPFYVTGKVGEVFAFSSAALTQNKTDIMVEIAKAIELVDTNGYN